MNPAFEQARTSLGPKGRWVQRRVQAWLDLVGGGGWARQGAAGFSHWVAVLCSCTVLGAAVQAFFTCDGFVLRQVDAAMQTYSHVGGRGRGRRLLFGRV